MESLIFFARLVCIAAWLLVAFTGWRMFVTRRRRAGNTFLAIALAGLSGMAAVPAERHHRSVAQAEIQPILEASPLEAPSLAVEPSKPPPQFWASSIGATYHLPTCRYAGSVKHSLAYETEVDAIASGRRPCKYCISTNHVSLK